MATESNCDTGVSTSAWTEAAISDLKLKLVASDGGAADDFGWSVSVSGDRAIVGAPGNSESKGAAYIFERNTTGTWTQKQKITASDGAADDQFGYSVSIDGERAIVGAFADDDARGAAYIFELTSGTWTQKQKVTANDRAQSDYFGYSVAISGDRAIVGASYDDDKGASSGSAYVFLRGTTTWTQQQKLTASDGLADDYFGQCVSISGDRVIVGASGVDDKGSSSGSAYLFELVSGTWTQRQELTASDGAANDLFGWSVSISGDRAVVSANGDDDRGSSSGSAYVFVLSGSTWTQEQKLGASDGTGGDRFGSYVAISDGRVIVGAEGDDKSRGAAYIFDYTPGQWYQTQKLRPPDARTNTEFGSAVAVSGDWTIGGDWTNNAAYTFEVITAPSDIAASDGALKSRVRITWVDRSINEEGFRIYRDGEPIANLEPNVEVYEDFDAEPGRTYEYGVAALTSNLSEEMQPFTDFGWRPANGSITGRVATVAGAAADSVWLAVTPLRTSALHFDGKGGYVNVPDPTEKFNFGSSNSYTIECWFKCAGSLGTGTGDETIIAKASPGSNALRFPFSLGNMRGTGEPGRLYFAMSDSAITPMVTSSRTDFNDDTWHHVACVHESAQEQMTLYVDGVLEGSAPCAGLGDISNPEPLSLGAGPASGSWFGGQLDEVRIWNVARSAAEIQAMLKQPLRGDEAGLLAYWPLNARWQDGEEGMLVVTDLTSGAQYGRFMGGVYWTDTCAPLDIYPLVDRQGNYVLNGLYYGTEAEFEVRPFQGNRQFDPPAKRVVLTTDSPVENQVNFTDVSSFTVSGTVRYANTNCPVADISILVDSRFAGSTDKNGKFAVAMNRGPHWIRPDLEDHIFGPDSLLVDARRDTVVNGASGVAFADSTARTLSGRLGGGCGRPVGDLAITIQSENLCYLQTLAYSSGDTLYSVSLPPERYLVSASVDPLTIPPGLGKTDVMRFFQNLGSRLADLDSTSVTMDFAYRAPLQVKILGLEQYVETCTGPLEFEGRKLPDNLPVIEQLTDLDLTIEVNELYGNGETCPLDSGIVVIYDEIFDRQNAPFEVKVRNGEANFKSYASTPSLVVGRIDEQGKDRSFQKSLQAVVNVEGRAPASATQWVLVTGHVAFEGADFVTAKAGTPMFVLRDPPGDASYSSLQQGYTSRVRQTWEKTAFKIWGGPLFELFWGLEAKTFIGFGAGTILDNEIKFGIQTEQFFGNMHLEEDALDLQLTTRETFATSTDDLLVCGGGDVFVGLGVNYIFSRVGVIEVDECKVVKSLGVGFEANGIETVYAYTEDHLRTVLIPELRLQEEIGRGTVLADSAKARREVWEALIDENDRLKTRAKDKKLNRSFSAGADYTYTHTTDSTRTYQRTNTFFWDSKSSAGWTWDFPGHDGSLGVRLMTHAEDLTNPLDGPYDDVDSTGTASRIVTYTLSDDDIGDRFTVGIKEDTVYGTPVFDVRAGASSCPYEPWPDSTGAARMVPRDKPKLYVSPAQRDAVPADKPAVFTLNLANLSPSGESRLYVLRLLTNSNPYGAIVKVGGVPISNGLQQYFIDAGQAQQATLTVERGPTRYSYNDPPLALILYPPCEYERWERAVPLQQADTVYVRVTFDAPCSDITLLEPASGWVFDRAAQESGNPILLFLTDYERQITESDTLQSVLGEYRRLGSGSQGPAPWTPIPAESLGTTETLIAWYPPEALEDGVYELRAFTQCERGRGFSEVATGTIERHGPIVLGTPQPADGELSFGEDITITFNETLDCRSVSPDSVTLVFVDGPSAGSQVPLETICSGGTIVLRPTASPNELEGRRIEARVAGVRDKAGNQIVKPVTWSFDYRKSRFTWNRLYLAADVPYRNPGTITAELVNGTGKPVEFTVTEWPAWVTAATPAAGTILPNGKQSVSLALQADLPMDVYEGEVTAVAADSTQGVAVLDLHVAVTCQAPQWAVDPSGFEHTMTMVAEVDIEGTLSEDSNDRVAAFVGNQLRGVANVMHVAAGDQYLAFLTVYGNRAQGETVRFQVWDDGDCKLYNSTLESHPFVANSSLGSTTTPVTLTAADVPGSDVLTIAVNQGWTWISTNMRSADMSVNAVLSDLTPEEGNLIKSQAAFSQFADSTWSGNLINLDNLSGYMIRLSEPGAILHTGAPVDTLVPVHQGWNWISYMPQGPIEVNAALADLHTQGLVAAGDQVKSQTGFVEYSGGAWYGSLGLMEPGKGYKLHRSSASNGSFMYPPYVSPPLLAAETSVPQTQAERTEGTPEWSVNPCAYQFNMTLTAVLRIDGRQSTDEYDMVAAFVGDECRGVVRPVYVEQLGSYAAFLMIHSNAGSGEQVVFRAFDADQGLVYNVRETLVFEADAVAGSIRQPRVLDAAELWSEDMALPRAYNLSQNSPNPFNPKTTIAYDVPAGGGHVTLRIYDVAGRLVRTLVDGVETPGRKAISWDGRSNDGRAIATGLYFYRMTAPGFEKTLKMMMMK